MRNVYGLLDKFFDEPGPGPQRFGNRSVGGAASDASTIHRLRRGLRKESAMASIGEITFQGKSGASYGFTIYNWGTTFEAFGAVYVVTKRASTGYTPLYVGQTEDMSERFDNHHKAGCFERNGADSICVRTEESESSRLAIEADLVANYNPICND